MPKLKSQTISGIKTDPLEKYLHLCCMLQYNWRGRVNIGAALSQKSEDYQFTFGFECAGIHPTLPEDQLLPIFAKLEAGLKELPFNEQLTLHMSSFCAAKERLADLEDLWERAPSKDLRLYLKSDQKRVEDLYQRKVRKPKCLRLYVTYTAIADTTQDDGLVDRILAWMYQNYERLAKDPNTQTIRMENLLDKGFIDGFLVWENLLSKMGLEFRPLSDQELWDGMWKQINRTDPIPVPQRIVRDNNGLHEQVNSNIHPLTLLLETVPTADRTWVHSADRYCGVLTLLDKPGGWSSHSSQIRYLWEILSKERVYDTEIFCQLTRANGKVVKDGMMKLIKQSNRQANTATSQNTVDVAAELKVDKAVDAQAALLEGATPIWLGLAILVHRQSTEQLDEACRYLESCFNRPAWVKREIYYAWRIWLQTLPICWETLLASPYARRLLFLHTEVPGLMPIVKPRSIDKTGLELITEEGGCPILLDLFNYHRNLALFATTRAGKSVLVSTILTQALSAGIPVRALDFPKPDGTSTFTDYTKSLGGAYFDICLETNNLFEIPDLRSIAPEQHEERMADYVAFLETALLTLVLGREKDPSLNSQCRSIISIALSAFFAAPEIQECYQRAFADGLKSEAWQAMPTLADFSHFCKPEVVGIELTEGIVKQAFEVIDLRLRFWINSRVGRAIATPSTINTNSSLLIFALRNVDNDEDAAILALSALGSTLRCALSSPNSIFFIDEAPILFEFDEIARLVARLCANGAKAGIRVILAGQDPDTIANSVVGSKILQNLTTRLIGRIQASAIDSFVKYFGYPREVISRNATEAFFPRKQDIYSQWLLDEAGKYTFVRFYPGLVQLAAVANNPDEQAMRDQHLKSASDPLVGLVKFANVYETHIRAS